MHTTRTRPAALLTATALLLAGTACSSNPEAAEPKPSKSSPRTQFLTSVHNADMQSWTTTAPSDGELHTLAKNWCTELDAGHSVEYLFSHDGAYLYPNGEDWGTQEADANQLLVLAVTAYCPEHRKQVTAELREDGAY